MRALHPLRSGGRGAWRAGRALVTVLLVLAAWMSIGCARMAPAGPSRVLAGASARGLVLEDPLAVSREAIEAAAVPVALARSTEETLRMLRDLLYVKSDRPFEYAPHLTLTAERAFRERRGDCMAFSMLFAALARGLGIPVYFVHVRDVESYYERGGELFVSSHVAVGHGHGPNARIFDFRREITDWRLSIYRNIDDDSARALYFNNMAVDWMLAGRHADAAKLFEVLVERAPAVAEPFSNFGVLLFRMRRFDASLDVLTRGIERFASYKPLYTNAIATADALGRHDVVARLEAARQGLLRDDPIYVFGRGMRFLAKGAYLPAVTELRRANEAMPDSAVVLVGLGRAYVGAGDLEKGAEALEAAKKLAAASLKRQLEDKLSRVRALQGKADGPPSGN